MDDPKDNTEQPDEAGSRMIAELQMQKAMKAEHARTQKSIKSLKGVLVVAISFAGMGMVNISQYLPICRWNCHFWASLFWIGVSIGIIMMIFAQFTK